MEISNIQKLPENVSFSARDQVRLREVISFLEENMSKGVTLGMLAENLGVSKATVSQLFKSQFNMTFHQYLDQQRMEIAKKLMETDISLLAISQTLGYRNYYSFYSAFRKNLGISPQRFRDMVYAKQVL